MKLLLLSPLALAMVAFTGCQTLAPKGPDRFAKADTNNDGKLSLDEVNRYLVTKIFESRDKNHDGIMTWQEWSVEGATGNNRKLHQRDRNKDGVVTLDEALADGRKEGIAKRLMDAADLNHDGYLSRAELTTYYAKHEY